VAFILVPQSLAYAQLAGLPAYYGLYAAALPPLAASFFASSPYLQTGPTALTSILTFGILAATYEPGSTSFILSASLLALIVGITRLAIGLLRLGQIAYLMSQPVLMGFTTAAAILIAFSPLPATLGTLAQGKGIVGHLVWALTHPASWNPVAIGLAVLTLVLMLGGRRLSPRFPGVLVAVALGIVISTLIGYDGPTVGAIGPSLPQFSLALPWASASKLLLGGVVIAVVGFAEATSIGRTFAVETRTPWDPNREFVGQGAANLASGLFGGFPVGGSFSRSSLNRLTGGRSRWSGAVAGLAVLIFLPFAGILTPLPKAVLGAIVIGAILGLLRFRPLLRLWRYSRPQFAVAWATFFLTLLLAPRIDYAVLVGVALAFAVHLWRELGLEVSSHTEGNELYMTLSGVLWFGSLPRLERAFRELVSSHQEVRCLIVDAGGLGRIDVSGAMLLNRLVEDATAGGLEVELRGLPERTREMLEHMGRA
jgi:SulP family sulfate permease